MNVLVSDAQVDAFQADGAVVLRALLTPAEIERLRAGIEKNLAHPSPRAKVASERGFKYHATVVRVFLPAAEILDEPARVITVTRHFGARARMRQVLLYPGPQQLDLGRLEERAQHHGAIRLEGFDLRGGKGSDWQHVPDPK